MKEIEIKFHATNEVLSAVRASQLLIKHSKQKWQSKELFNQYLDTEQQDLTGAGVALRVRKDGEQYIQTLKAKGHSIGGLSERDEFDWYIKDEHLDLSLLDAEHWPPALADLDKTTLAAIFATDFIRDYILVDWQQSDVSARFEVAVDRGIIKTANNQQPLNELELELKQGNVTAMLGFAIKLADKFPLIPSDLSKAERGYRLLNPESFQFKIPEKLKEQDPIVRLKYYLRLTQRLLESYLWQPNLKVLVFWVSQLEELANSLLKIAPANLSSLLAPILQEWQHNVRAYDEQQLLDKVKHEVSITRWGVFSLSVSRWLLSKG